MKEDDEEMRRHISTVEIETLRSGQTEKCHDKDLRAANVGLIGGLIGSARAALLTFQAGSSLVLLCIDNDACVNVLCRV